MHDHATNPAGQAGQLDRTVERLTSESTSLKLELATLYSAVNELQTQQLGRRLGASRSVREPVPRASNVPAAAIVLIAGGLLAWQLIMMPRPAGPGVARASVTATARPRPEPARVTPAAAPVVPPPVETPATAIGPTIYRGTLAVAADQPAAEVFINRQRVGTAPVRVRNLRAGSHLVWIESEGHRRWTRVVTVPAEKVTRVTADLEPMDIQ